MIHGPTEATTDVLTETELVDVGETWTVIVTPSVEGVEGPTASGKVKILDSESGVTVWGLYK